MAEAASENPESQPTRRNVLAGLVRVGVAVGAAAVVESKLHPIRGIINYGNNVDKAEKKDELHSSVQNIFTAGVNDYWETVSVFPGLIAISNGVGYTNGIFSNRHHHNWPGDGEQVLIAVRPFFVRDSLAHNARYYEDDAAKDIRQTLHDIPRGLLGMWRPDGSGPIYFDADANTGLITPITRNTQAAVGKSGYKVIPQTINIDGRERRKEQTYPYIEEIDLQFDPQEPAPPLEDFDAYMQFQDNKNNYKGVKRRKLLGYVVALNQTVDFDNFMFNFLHGKEPFELPGI